MQGDGLLGRRLAHPFEVSRLNLRVVSPRHAREERVCKRKMIDDVDLGSSRQPQHADGMGVAIHEALAIAVRDCICARLRPAA